MPVTLQEILQQLDVDEPNYAALSALGPDAAPHLAGLVRGDDPGIASKAAYLASLIPAEECVNILSEAASSGHDVVRVAAAAGLRNLSSTQAEPLVSQMLDDTDAGVRKQAVRAYEHLGIAGLGDKVKAMAANDADTAIRQHAGQAVKGSAAAPAPAKKALQKKAQKKRP